MSLTSTVNYSIYGVAGAVSRPHTITVLQEYRPRWALDVSTPHMSFALATGVGNCRVQCHLATHAGSPTASMPLRHASPPLTTSRYG
jgi:hypothetical protein